MVNKLLTNLDGRAATLTAEHAEDVSVIISGKYLGTLSSLENQTLKAVSHWATEVGLSVNAKKTDVVLLFTKKYKIPGCNKPKFGETTLKPKPSTKYLGEPDSDGSKMGKGVGDVVYRKFIDISYQIIVVSIKPRFLQYRKLQM